MASLLCSLPLISSVLADVPKITLGNRITTISPLRDAITQNTPGGSEGYALGVPKNFAWYCGSYKPASGNVPPPDFSAVTGWGQIYPKAGHTASWNASGRITIANAKTYVHLKNSRQWIVVQNQTDDPIAGGHFVADFAGNAAREMKVKVASDGSAIVGLPPGGYNNHFWMSERGTYPAGNVDGVYVQMDVKVSDPNIKLVANVGADWWRNATADYVKGFANNPGAGMSNWVELSTAWSTLRFYSLSTSSLRANPPPPLKLTERGVARRPNTSSPCLTGVSAASNE